MLTTSMMHKFNIERGDIEEKIVRIKQSHYTVLWFIDTKKTDFWDQL